MTPNEVGHGGEEESSAGIGKYRILLRLDQGGMAEVFLAVSHGPAGFNKLFVIKRLREALADNLEHRDMFLHEARLAARLNHPNVVQTYEVGEDGTAFFMAMEYLEGQPLNRLRREIAKRALPVAHAIYARIVSEVLCGLHYAHEVTDYDGSPLKIVHRDVSPQNVFVTYDGQVKIVDFGIAKTSDTVTQAGIFKGKFAYTAPEQLLGEAIDRRADIFTAGIVLFELLTGTRLLASDNAAKTLSRLLHEPIPRVSSIVPEVDPALDAIVARALQRKAVDRYQSAQDMRDALETYIGKCGQVVRQEEIARLVVELFKSERARVQKAIKDQIAMAMHPPSSSRIVAAPRLLLTTEHSTLANLGVKSTTARTLGPTSNTSPGEAPELEVVTPRKQRTLRTRLSIIGLGLVLSVGVGWLAFGRHKREAPALPIAAAEAPKPTVTQPPATTSTSLEAIGATQVATPTEVPEPVNVAPPKAALVAPRPARPHPPKPAASSATAAPAPTPVPMPEPPQAPTGSQKEKRKFHTEL